MSVASAANVPAGAASTAALPPLSRDPSFLGMTATQFLGAFNDNLFKQMVLLLCLDIARAPGGKDWQGLAGVIFAVPFILFSGFAGWLSDRTPKRGLVVLCKVAEIVIMAAGVAAFFFGNLRPETQLVYLFIVLAMMSTQSAYFGPAKYGILPELFRDRDLPTANGLIQMTTFLAIIFGTALAGFGKDMLEGQLWIISACCVGIAVAGTLTSLPLRKTPVAQPGLKLKPSSLAIDSSLWKVLKTDRKLLGVLLVSSLFWMVAGLVYPFTMNAVGKLQLGLSDTRTSLLGASIGIGIAAGCVLAGWLSQERIRFGLVRIGSWGLIGCMLLCAVIAYYGIAPQPPQLPENEAFAPANPAQWPLYPVAMVLGIFAGLFAVPVQVFLQHRPPRELKGRMIGAMNLCNWIGIVIAAGIYSLLSLWLGESRQYGWAFAVAAALLVPVALFYRPADEPLTESVMG